MLAELEKLHQNFKKDLENISDIHQIEPIEKNFLGKTGELKEILKNLKDLSPAEKKKFGPLANDLKISITESLQSKKVILENNLLIEKEKAEAIDVSLEFPVSSQGHKHPITLASEFLEEIFISMGFTIEDGPQIENEEFNFDKLNIPDNHPARDVWDTFWLDDSINHEKPSGQKLLLRTHTSPVQVRNMLKGDLPLKIIVPGRVFRYEQEDARHTSNFYQLEGLVIGENVNFAQLQGTLSTAMKKLLGESTQTRFRPSIFPFTEPSAEVDVSCQICKGTGIVKDNKCSMCSATGWVELLGAGMVHPKVLIDCGIDPKKYSGFAFGMGIDRIAAQRFSVSSSRMFYQNKLKLNHQF